MRNTVLCGVAGLLFSLAGCAGGDEGEPVALNERIFALESGESLGAGCTLFVLGRGAQSGSGGGAVGSGPQVRTSLDEDTVVVSVLQGDVIFVQRRYDEAFFRSGTVDEFTLVSATGSGGFRLRYWGTFHPDGPNGCAPLDEDGPR